MTELLKAEPETRTKAVNRTQWRIVDLEYKMAAEPHPLMKRRIDKMLQFERHVLNILVADQ